MAGWPSAVVMTANALHSIPEFACKRILSPFGRGGGGLLGGGNFRVRVSEKAKIGIRGKERMTCKGGARARG